MRWPGGAARTRRRIPGDAPVWLDREAGRGGIISGRSRRWRGGLVAWRDGGVPPSRRGAVVSGSVLGPARVLGGLAGCAVAGWPPVPAAEQGDSGGDEQGADEEGVHEDAD